MKNLSKRTDIIIRKSDKGDTIVVETMHRYINDGLQHLSDEEVYHHLPNDVTEETHKIIVSFVEHCFARGLINHDIYQFLRSTKQPETPIIFFLNKDPISVRSIVSNVGSPTRTLSLFMDKLLKPIVENKQHIFKNSTQLIMELEQIHVSEDDMLM